MKKKIFCLCTLVALFVFSVGEVFATTWFDQEFVCPIDKTKNTFKVVGSYGSYIYSWPSKYQWLFFPRTDSPTFYLCSKCHLATYMWDFDSLPTAKLIEIQKQLAGIKVSKSFRSYLEIPVTERLEIMEKVYSVLDKDESWWENFYRVQGYHYANEGNVTKAAEKRRKSLEIITKQLKENKGDNPRKLLYYISGAMKHFLEDDLSAIADLQIGLETKYEEKGLTAEELNDREIGMNERIKDFIERIKSDKKPRMMLGK